MRAVGVHADVIVVTSAIWATTCTAIRGGPEEAFVVDSPVLPDELEALPRLLEQAGFRVAGLLATHADWDHVLAPTAFPEAPLGVGEATARRLQDSPGEAQRELREFDDRYYIQRPPLRLGGVRELPVPGRCEVGERELELHEAAGHTADGTAILAPWAGVLCCGDYLSPVEIPMLWTGADPAAYRATLERLRGLVERAETVVPGHGPPLPREQALEVLEEDLAYLEALERGGEEAPLPRLERSPEQRRVHEANVARR